jgi:hypothetical protein
MQRLWDAPEAEGGGLLRILLLRRRAMPADSGSKGAWRTRCLLRRGVTVQESNFYTQRKAFRVAHFS